MLWCTLLARSIGWLAIDDPCAATPTLCRTEDGRNVTAISRKLLTAMVTSALASPNPGALTVTRHAPGVRSSR